MVRAIAMRVFSTTTEMNQIIETAKAISEVDAADSKRRMIILIGSELRLQVRPWEHHDLLVYTHG